MEVIRGLLEIEIVEARNLPDTDKFLFSMFKKDLTDPYVSGYIGATKILMTSIKDNNLNPSWGETFSIQLCHRREMLRLVVQDKDHAWSEKIGEVSISFDELKSRVIDGI